jgi:DNA processing protein
MGIAFLDFIFWKMFATRLAPVTFYLEVLETYEQLCVKHQCLPGQKGFLPRWNSVMYELALRHPFLRGCEVPTDAQLRAVYRDVLTWSEAGYEFILTTHRDFPTSLIEISDPPRGLFLWGQRALLWQTQLAVVGSREPTAMALAWIETELSEFLRRNPEVNIVSGGARGVDSCAHRVSLRKARPTLVLVPAGFQKMYPASLADWAPAILKGGGLFISEYAPDTLMRKSFFGERNRLISALSRAVLIVEARRRSGTLLTAKAAADQARPVFVVPGAPYDPQSAGSLDLIGEGATMVRDAQELSVFFQDEIRNTYWSLKESSTASHVTRPLPYP